MPTMSQLELSNTPPRLTTLPAEIKAMIWTNLTPAQSKGPACKALLPYHRLVKFKKIALTNVQSLSRLYLLLLSNDGIGASCRELSINLKFSKAGGESSQSIFYLGAIFRALTHVKWVTFSKSTAAAILLLHEDISATCFRHMEQVSLQIPSNSISGREEEELSTIIQSLKHYPALKNLDFVFGEGVKVAVGTIILPNITALALHGRLGASIMKCLAPALPSLKTFDYMPDNLNAAETISNLAACPSTLSSLMVFHEEGWEVIPSNSQLINQALTRFAHLEALYIWTPFISRALFQNLQDLPLNKLSLGPPACHAVFIEDLRQLITPHSTRYISTLKELVISVWGSPADVEWVKGKLDYKGCKDLVEVGKQTGVRISGTVIEAMGLREKQEKRAAKASKRRKGRR